MWVWMLLTLFTLVGEWHGRCYGCLEEERIGLLEIKSSFDPNGYHLRYWVDTSNCCDWGGVECDNTTRRVIQLDLLGVRDESLGDLVLNASLFLPFKELRSLDLSVNAIVGCHENQGFEVLSSKLRKLNVLDLGQNRFNDDSSMLSCFTGLSSLKSLYLSDNMLTGSTGVKVLSSRLKKLENLVLSWNRYNDSIFSSLTGFSSLKSLDLSSNLELKGSSVGVEVLSSQLRKLERLDLSYNGFNDNILPHLCGFSSLKTLNLSGNMVSGSTTCLRKLEVLSLNQLPIIGSTLLQSLGALPSLKILSLKDNNLSSTSISQVTFFNMTTLEELYLDHSALPINFLQNIGQLPALKILSVCDCDLIGTLPTQGLDGLKNVEQLDLSGNKLEVTFFNMTTLEELYLDRSTIPINFLQNIGQLNALNIFSVRDCNLTGTLPAQVTFFNMTILEELYLDGSAPPINFLQNIGQLPALKILSVRDCNLTGTLPTQGLDGLKNVELLDLSRNKLEVLDVSRNRFTGNIATDPLNSLISLEFLSLSNNLFELPLSFKSFNNHSKLKVFICDNCILVEDRAGFQNFIPKFQLMFFRLSHSTFKAINSVVPNFLYNQYDLRSLDLSSSNLSGVFPSWLLENNTRLEALYLRQNSFVGPLKLPNHPTPNMKLLDISNNNISGQVPRNICSVFPKLEQFMMAMNGLTGSIPSCFGNMSSPPLFIDLSHNLLSIVKPEQLKRSFYVKLSNNNLGGQISPSIFNSSFLRYLYLDGNKFTGHVFDFQPTNGIYLEALDISDNQFSGILPTRMGNFSMLQAIDLSRNHFDGPLPRDLCKLDNLAYLDLSENNLSGSVPSCFNPSSIKHVHLSKNQLSGPLTEAFYNSSSLVTLDIADNNLMGPISNWIGNLSALSVLILRDNQFAGDLPTQLCLLEHLTILDVSRNQLSGPLPFCLGNFSLKENLGKTGGTSGELYMLSYPWQISYETGLLAGKINDVGSCFGAIDAGSCFGAIDIEETVEFTTKRRLEGYKGTVLNFMTGFDLSSNRFSGKIPLEMGKLSELHALNLSHNNLTGSIPATFSNLKQIESLDLSHNNFDGVIPPQLDALNNLAVFSVAHNNLSGKAPERKAQFGTFDESSYEGNPVPPLRNKCSGEESPSQPMPHDEREDDGFIDMEVFYVSFGVSYIILVLTIAAVLYINPLWRGRWFHFIEECIDTCYCFLVVNFRKLSNFFSL
uniref:Leucine-rich repeat-containing N-terminal plant-type domain-containing protein n=1 Tax=Salix viminalis TaxID=40686 RepID=A0A6N2L0D9_SALVM